MASGTVAGRLTGRIGESEGDMTRLILYVVVGLLNFYVLARGGMFQWGAFLLFLVLVLGVTWEVFSKAQSRKGTGDSKDNQK
jgi:hypothetical protein